MLPATKQEPSLVRLPQELVAETGKHLSRRSKARLIKTCRHFAHGLLAGELIKHDARAEDYSRAIKWACIDGNMGLLAQVIAQGADFSKPVPMRGSEMIPPAQDFHWNYFARPLALAVSRNRFGIATHLLRTYGMSLAPRRWAECCISHPDPDISPRYKRCLISRLLMTWESDDQIPSDSLCAAREAFFDEILRWVDPRVCTRDRHCDKPLIALAVHPHVPYSIYDNLLRAGTGLSGMYWLHKWRDAEPGLYPWEMQLYSDSVIDLHSSPEQIVTRCELKFCRLLSRHPPATLPRGDHGIATRIIKILCAETTRSLRDPLLLRYLNILLTEFSVHPSDTTQASFPETLIEYAAKQVMRTTSELPPLKTARCIRNDLRHMQQDELEQRRLRRKTAIKVYHLLMHRSATQVETAAPGMQNQPSILHLLVQAGHEDDDDDDDEEEEEEDKKRGEEYYDHGSHTAPTTTTDSLTVADLVKISLVREKPPPGGHISDTYGPYEDTILHHACRVRHPSPRVIKILLAHQGFHHDVRNFYAQTPLHVLAERLDLADRVKIRIARILLRAGHDDGQSGYDVSKSKMKFLTARDSSGNDALEIAKIRGWDSSKFRIWLEKMRNCGCDEEEEWEEEASEGECGGEVAQDGEDGEADEEDQYCEEDEEEVRGHERRIWREGEGELRLVRMSNRWQELP